MMEVERSETSEFYVDEEVMMSNLSKTM